MSAEHPESLGKNEGYGAALGQPLTLWRLARTNLRRRAFRTGCLVFIVALFSAVLFGGAVLNKNTERGLHSMSARLGADLIIVPTGYQKDMQVALLRGEPSSFSINAGLTEQVRAIHGVQQASPQLFLASLGAACCDVKVQLVGFEPETDFVVRPWLKEQLDRPLGDHEIVVGSSIFAKPGQSIKFFNEEFKVAAKMDRTGMGFDSSVFFTLNATRLLVRHNANALNELRTVRALADQPDAGLSGAVSGGLPSSSGASALLGVSDSSGVPITQPSPAASAEPHIILQDTANPDAVISSVMVKIAPDATVDGVASVIRMTLGKTFGVDTVETAGLISSLASNLNFLTYLLMGASSFLWLLALIILFLVFSGSFNERKKEMAVLRVLGATKKRLAAMLLTESLIISVLGACIGVVCGWVVSFPFSALIFQAMRTPYLQVTASEALLLALTTLFLAAIMGPIASLWSVISISQTDVYATLREGE